MKERQGHRERGNEREGGSKRPFSTSTSDYDMQHFENGDAVEDHGAFSSCQVGDNYSVHLCICVAAPFFPFFIITANIPPPSGSLATLSSTE